jgi:hypothetical protein
MPLGLLLSRETFEPLPSMETINVAGFEKDPVRHRFVIDRTN